MNIGKYIQPISACTRKNAPTILTTLGIIGVASTAVFAVKDSKKAEVLICKRNKFKNDKYGEDLTKSEKVIAAFPAYIPTLLSGITTVSCIYGSNHINKNRQAMLISAYGYLNNCFLDYKDAVTELYGDDANEKIETHIIQTNAPVMDKDIRDEEIVIYEEYTDTYIKTTKNKLDIALYNANRHFNVFGAMSVNNFLDLLDIPEALNGDTYGWSFQKNFECDTSIWIDASICRVKSPIDHPLYRLQWNVSPSIDYVEWHLF